jgi:hypothetical protein
MVEGRKADDVRGERDVGVVQNQDRTSAAKQPTGFKPDADAPTGHLHAAGVGLEQLAMHHLGDQLRPVQAASVLRIGEPLGEDPGPVLDQGAMSQLNRFQAARAELAADGAAEVDLHRSTTVGVGFRFGRQTPTISITIPSTGSKGSTMPPRSALIQRVRKRRMAGLSDIFGRCDGLAGCDRVGRFVFHVEALVVFEVDTLRGRLPLPPSRRPLGRQRSDVEALAKQVNALEKGQPFDQPADPVVNREPGFMGRRMTMMASPAADRFLEGGGKATVSPTIGARVA